MDKFVTITKGKRQRPEEGAADGASAPGGDKRAHAEEGATAGAAAAAPPSGASAAASAANADLALAALGCAPTHPCAPFLRAQLARPYFGRLLAYLAAARARGPVFPPAGRELACLSLFPNGLGSVKVVILGQDPYHGAGQAHGLSFSVPRGVASPPSLRNILQELHADVGGGGGGGGGGGAAPAYHGNLEGWARSGVLLLNTCLTVASGAANSHAGQGWEAFTDALIVEVSRAAERGAVFILWGKPAQDKQGLIAGRGRHLVLQAPHPSPLSAYRGFFGSVRRGWL